MLYLQCHPQDWWHWSVVWSPMFKFVEEVYGRTVHSLSCKMEHMASHSYCKKVAWGMERAGYQESNLTFGLVGTLLMDQLSQYLGFCSFICPFFFSNIVIKWSISDHLVFLVIDFFLEFQCIRITKKHNVSTKYKDCLCLVFEGEWILNSKSLTLIENLFR